MTITVSLKVLNENTWNTIADKDASLSMPVTAEDKNWKETVKDKLQFFMQEAADMLIPAVKDAIDEYNPIELEEAGDEYSPPQEPNKLSDDTTGGFVPGAGDANSSVADAQA